jgi:tRNA threonylcarbamoyladenosine biosynthesis protein TsaB
MRFAALETSTQWCSVALWRDGEIAGVERRAGTRHSELALPMLENLLKKTGLTVEGLDAVAFGAGPGSFTGLRIACGLAQGLALARGIPVIGVSTLEALAEDSGAPRVVACIDARMREVYYAALQRDDRGRWREVIAATCAAPAAISLPPGDWIGAGNGFAVYGNLSLKTVRPEMHPTAMAVARLAAPRLDAGEGVDAALAAPVYVRDKVAFTKVELDRQRANSGPGS